MSDIGHRVSGPPASAGSDGSATAASRPQFAGHPHVGWFVVTRVEQTPARQESHIPGLFVVPYRVTLEGREVLPPVGQTVFVIAGARGEGVEAGALGLQDWLPTQAGAEFVAAFDPARLTSASQMTFLAGGNQAAEAWNDARRFHDAIGPNQPLDPARVAAIIGRVPPPRLVFFRLLVAADRGVFRDPSVMRALGAYLASDRVPPLERRNVVAHYMGTPDSTQSEPLGALAGGMTRLAAQLGREGQAASASVVLERLYGYAFEPGTGNPLAGAPALDHADRAAVIQLLGDSQLGEAGRGALRDWLARP